MKLTEVSVVKRKDIRMLIEQMRDDNNVTIYMPTHIKGDKVEQDPIRFKNLLKRVEERLSYRGKNEELINKILSKAYDLLHNDDFWQHQDKGLALFCNDEYFTYFKVPVPFEELFNVGERFIITPIIPATIFDGVFYLLALSKKKVRFLKSTNSDIESIELDDMPTNYKDFMRYYVMQKQVQVHSGAPGRSSVYHGHGIGTDDERKHLENFVNAIENKVTSYLKNRNEPLLLAGVDKITSLYHSKNQYNLLKKPVIKGNPDRVNDKDLKNKAWNIIQKYYKEEIRDDLNKFGHLSDTTKTSTDLHDIVKSAYLGRIDTLFIAQNKMRWGVYDRSKNLVHVQEVAKTESVDLFNESAIETIQGDGTVYVIPKEQMPAGTDIAAIYRYS